MKNPLTTATSAGVLMRYVIAMVGTALATLGAVNVIDPAQVALLTEQSAVILTALGTLISSAITAYAMFTKSSSDKAAEVAKQVDQQVHPADPVTVQTPTGQPDIVVPGAKAA